MNRPIVTLALAYVLSANSSAMQPAANFRDLVSNAHLVLTAKCVRIVSLEDPHHQGIITSQAYFVDHQVIRSNRSGSVPVGDTLVLDYVGGTVNGLTMGTCEMPDFAVGEHYLLFLLNDGQRFLTPLIGGVQGQYRSIPDERTGVRYLLDASGHGLVRFDDGGILKSTRKVIAVSDGRPRYVAHAEDDEFGEEARDGSEDADIPLLTLDEAIANITDLSFERPTFQDRYTSTRVMPQTPLDITPGISTRKLAGQERGTLGACYHQDVYIWFEENGGVPGYDTYGDWSAIEDYGKGIWDVHMNIFSDTPNPTDGFWPDNGECEVAGWLTSGALNAYYGGSWGTAYAATFWWANGNEIVEADIAMNASLNWVDNWSDAYATPNVNYRNVIVHEFGHTWGYQSGSCHTESYDYAYPSVMHAYYHYLWEDGKEVHSMDAKIIRNLYDDQTTIRPVHDLGVESYRALSGSPLQNSSAVPSSVPSGSSVHITNITVENCGVNTQPYVHLEAWLSPDRSLGGSDHLVGDFALGSMNPVSRILDAYTLDTDGVPAGTYYVGFKVRPCTYCDDDRPANDVTWSTYTITVTGSVGIGETPSIGTLSVHPNPTTDLVRVQLPNGSDHGLLQVADPTGRIVREIVLQGRGELRSPIDLADVTPGLYSIRYVDKDGDLYVARVVKR